MKGVWLVRSASAVDWEDMAAGPGWSGKALSLLWRHRRQRVEQTRLLHLPRPGTRHLAGAASGRGGSTSATADRRPTLRILVAYPDGPHNAETLLCIRDRAHLHSDQGRELRGGGVSVLEERQGWTGPHTTRRVAVLKLPEVVCGGAFRRTAAGLRFADTGACTLTPPDGSPDFDEVWKQQPKSGSCPP